jgi:hypothetical protein
MVGISRPFYLLRMEQFYKVSLLCIMGMVKSRFNLIAVFTVTRQECQKVIRIYITVIS